MQAGSSGALGTPTGYLAHGLPPHIGADGRHGSTATAWKSAKSAIFAAQIRVNPCYLLLQSSWGGVAPSREKAVLIIIIFF